MLELLQASERKRLDWRKGRNWVQRDLRTHVGMALAIFRWKKHDDKHLLGLDPRRFAIWPEAVGFEFVWGSYCFTGTRSSFNFCFLHPNCMQVRFILMVIKGEMVSIPNEKQSVALGAFDKSHGNLWMVVLIGLNQISRSLHGILPFPAMRLWQNESVTS